MTGQSTKIDNQESRLKNLENSSENNSDYLPNYFKYLSTTDRKNMICGYAVDNNITHISDLGFNCDITYRLIGKTIRSTCKCKEIK